MSEIERLRFELKAAQEEIRIADGEIERLIDELHHCEGICDLAMKHRDLAEAEVKRLRSLYLSEAERLNAEIERLFNDNERMKAALEIIAGQSADQLQALQAKAALSNIGS